MRIAKSIFGRIFGHDLGSQSDNARAATKPMREKERRRDKPLTLWMVINKILSSSGVCAALLAVCVCEASAFASR